MPSVRSNAEADLILAAVRKSGDGLGLQAMQVLLGDAVARRTLQRRLAGLVETRRLITEGEGRALKYRLAPGARSARPPRSGSPGSTGRAAHARPRVSAEPAVSPEGEEIRAYVRRPLLQRRPAGYDMAWLDRYLPNQTFYLPEALRAQLHAMGRSNADPQAPAGTFARDILGRLLIDLSWASSRLEGNTYTRLDTERLIEFGHAAEGKDAFETQMILNHKAAIEFLVGHPDLAVDAETVLGLHALLSDGLLRDAGAGGRVRRRAVEITGSVYRPIALPQRLEELFAVVLRMAAEIRDPFEQAFFLMVQLPYLQPFEDVNKRVSRLAANIPLLRHNLSPLSFIDVPPEAYVEGTLGVYELTRVELLRDVFVAAYERSCQQYVAVKQQLVPPDAFRLRYRAEISEAVRALVQGGSALSAAQLRHATPASVVKPDRARFAEQLRAEFETLHDGNAVRFGLRPLEVAAYQRQRRRSERRSG